jgi:hypothetical protein
MTVHNAASASVTNADASPRVANTAGSGSAGNLVVVDDYVTVPAAAAATSVFRFVRVKSNIIVKAVTVENEAQGAGKIELGVYYADTAIDIAPGNSANLGLAIDASFFSGDIDLTSAFGSTNETYNAGSTGLSSTPYTQNKRGLPLWDALGLATDPGGKFDICGTVHTTDVTTGTGRTYVKVEFIEP